MPHTIKIIDKTYSILANRAAEAGVSPEVWVELKVKESIAAKGREAMMRTFSDMGQKKPQKETRVAKQIPSSLKKTLKRTLDKKRKKDFDSFIGAVDSSKSSVLKRTNKETPFSKRLDKLFGQIVEEKMRKQGLKV